MGIIMGGRDEWEEEGRRYKVRLSIAGRMMVGDLEELYEDTPNLNYKEPPPIYYLYIETIPFGARICVAENQEKAIKKLYPQGYDGEEPIAIQQMPLDTPIKVHGYLDFKR